MSQQQIAKPSLQGVRIRARKGAVRAHAKHEPTGKLLEKPPPPPLPSPIQPSDHHLISLCSLICSCVCEPRWGSTVFRDQLYKHFETVPSGDFDAFSTKLTQAGSTLEFLKYADALFEILFVGGLLQPGGSYIDDGSPICSWAIVNATPASADNLKKYVDVQNQLIRR